MTRPTRRDALLRGLCWCALLPSAGCNGSLGNIDRLQPGYRPARATDEDELWKVVDRSEADLKRSRHLVRDPELVAYVREIACRLADAYCPDIRVYVLRTAFFNASMAPNGTMQVWTGLLLRMHNEAQLAAILGHEIGHYLARHTLQLWRDAQAAQTLVGLANIGLNVAGLGSVANFTPFAALAALRAFSREHEREADDIGFDLMLKAGYRAEEAARVWEQLIAERNAGKDDPGPIALFATHPPHEARMQNLRARAAGATQSGGEIFDARYHERTAAFRPTLFRDELKLGRYDRSLVVFEQIARDRGEDGELAFWTGEAHRMRDKPGDQRLAREAYARALAYGNAPAETHRSLGLVAHRAGDNPAADAEFRRYLELAPNAGDRDLIRSFIST